MAAEVLAVHSIGKGFPGVQALQSVSLALNRGEVLALVGENGAGKSTLVRILTGTYLPDSGFIEVAGERVLINSVGKALSLGIAAVPQELQLVPEMTVAENIFLGREPRRRLLALTVVDRRQMNREAARILADLDIAISPTTPVKTLGAAERQLVQIAKLMGSQARIMILDEPTASLTARERERLFALIKELQRQGVAFIYISHRLEEVFLLAQRVTVLRDGQVVGTFPMESLTTDQLVRLMVGRTLTELFRKSRTSLGPVVMQAERLTRQGVFSDISFSLHQGEILGIYGLVGAKRTDVLRALFGVDPVSSGTVTIDGRRQNHLSPVRAVRLGLSLLPEERKQQALCLGQSVQHNMSQAAIPSLTRAGFLQFARERRETEGYVRHLHIKTPGMFQKIKLLSGGNQQKVIVGRWLMARARIFLFDEPTRGIDVGAKAEIYDIMQRLVSEGAAVLMVSSDLPEILGICDRILVMREGRLAGQFNRAEATEESITACAFGQMAKTEGA